MQAAAVLSLVMLVLGALSSAMGGFPLANTTPAQQIDKDTPFGPEAVQQTADQFGNMYTALIDELMTFLDDPDYARAEARSAEITAFASALAIDFDNLATELETELASLTAAPAAPTGLLAALADSLVSLVWDQVTATDVLLYNVYRATTAGGPYGLVAGITTSQFADLGLTNGTTYHYVVTVADTAGNESAYSNEASATPQP